MKFLVRTGTFVLQLAVFFALLALLSYLTTYFTAERYTPRDNASTLFPLVALAPDTVASAAPKYELLRWPQLARKDPPPLKWNLRLPVAKGEFTTHASGGFEPFVRFSAVNAADGRQRVDVTVTDDDYVLYATYSSDGAKAQPEILRIWGPTSALFAVFPAFMLTMVFSRLFRRWRERRRVSDAG